MKIERLDIDSKRNKIIFVVGFILAIILVIVINYITSLARYRNTESIELASGNINYNKADLNIIAMYQESSYGLNGYKQIDDVPTEKYTLSNKSYCEVGDQKIEEAQITYEEGYISVSKINKRGTKCYIYFDLDYKADDMLAKLETTKQSTYEKTAMPNSFSGLYNEQEENPEGKEKLYTTEDNYGTSYVFRGNNNDVNNWVTFANHTWRIIRINGDGTLRMIFQCAEPNCQTTEGEETQIGTSAYKSAPYDDNTYVGYYYGTSKADKGEEDPTYEETHSNSNPSTIAQAVNEWYTGTGAMTNYTKYLSGNTGWCNDRTVVKGTWGSYIGDGTGQLTSGYASASRLLQKGGTWRAKQYPTLKCGVIMPETAPTEEEGATYFSNFEVNDTSFKRDLFTTTGSNRGNGVLSVPAALITSDEVVMTGGFGGMVSTNYWLYTNQSYWTMSPLTYADSKKFVEIIDVRSEGYLIANSGGNALGVRPVINLNADIEFNGGTGKSDNPFIVKTTI